jgi:hypothetical protein
MYRSSRRRSLTAFISGRGSPGVAWKKEGLFDGAPLDLKTLTFAAAARWQDY